MKQTIIDYCESLSTSWHLAINPTRVDQIRRNLISAGVLPRSRGRKHHEVTPKDAAYILIALSITGTAEEVNQQTETVGKARDADGKCFIDIFSEALACNDTRTLNRFALIKSITVSSSSAHAKINYAKTEEDGRLGEITHTSEFGSSEGRPIELYGTISASLTHWAGCYFVNHTTKKGELCL